MLMWDCAHSMDACWIIFEDIQALGHLTDWNYVLLSVKKKNGGEKKLQFGR